MSAVQKLAPHVGQSAACRALSVPRASWYRSWQPVVPPTVRPTPARALPLAERQIVLDHLHSERFRDKSPAEAFATLLDEGVYLCSVSSMYRIWLKTARCGSAGTSFVIPNTRSRSCWPLPPIKFGAGI